MITSNNLFKTRLVLSFLGFLDATYLTIIHFQNQIPPCTTDGCETVLTSSYAEIAGIPIALLGALYYVAIFFSILTGRDSLAFFIVSLGFIASCILFSLQLFVIHAFCTYCLVSAGITTLLFITSILIWRQRGNSI